MAVGIQMPDERQLPPGPLRQLVEALQALYRQAGKPGLRLISNEVNRREDLPDTLSHEGVAALLRGAGKPRWAKVESLVRVLCGWSIGRPDVEAEVRRVHALWLAASDTEDADDGPVKAVIRTLRSIALPILHTTDAPSVVAEVVQQADGGILVTLKGTIDIAACPDLERALLEASQRASAAHPHVLDMTGIDFIDSTGVGVLVRHHIRVSGGGSSLSILCSQQVFRVLRALGLDSLLRAEIQSA